MNTIGRNFLVTLLVFLGAAVTQAETLDIAKLRKGEEIEVKYTSYGDRHLIRRIYSIRGGDRISFTALELQTEIRSWKRDMKGKAEIPIGEVELTSDEIRGLDTYVVFLRAQYKSNCPTKDVIEVGYFRDGKRIGDESFNDQTCVATGIARVGGKVVNVNTEYRDFPRDLLMAIVTFPCIEERIVEELPDGKLADGTKASPVRP